MNRNHRQLCVFGNCYTHSKPRWEVSETYVSYSNKYRKAVLFTYTDD